MSIFDFRKFAICRPIYKIPPLCDVYTSWYARRLVLLKNTTNRPLEVHDA